MAEGGIRTRDLSGLTVLSRRCHYFFIPPRIQSCNFLSGRISSNINDVIARIRQIEDSSIVTRKRESVFCRHTAVMQQYRTAGDRKPSQPRQSLYCETHLLGQRINMR